MAVLVAPVIEEITKFLSFRAIQRRDTLIAVLTFMVLEIIFWTVENNLRSDPFITTMQILFGVGALKHIMFWVPEKLANFSIASLPVAIIFHSLWNIYAMAPEDMRAISTALLALATLPFLLLLFRESKAIDSVHTGHIPAKKK